MRRVASMFAFVALICASSAIAQADPGSVGLGVGIGAALPSGTGPSNLAGGIRSANFGWGFYVNIPLISTFHITPHAEIYDVNSKVTAADMGLEFKFVVPTPFIRPYVGVDIGDTTLAGSQHINAGGVVGATIHLVANLDAFLEGRYSVMIVLNSETGGNIYTAHVLAGILFRF
jgi:hypothetical protein